MKQILNAEDLVFDSVKENRGQYIVEYHPPIPSYQFSTLNLTFLHELESEDVARFMEIEARYWLSRYHVPVMVFAFDGRDNGIDIKGGHLVAFEAPDDTRQIVCWDIAQLSAFLKDHPSTHSFREIFSDISYRTGAQITEDANIEFKKQLKKKRFLIIILVTWFGVIPASFILIEYFSPDWVGAGIALFALWKIVRTVRKMLGHREPSSAEKKRSEKDSKMRHYYYHCEQNPAGFTRLMIENLEKDAEHRNRLEADKLSKG